MKNFNIHEVHGKVSFLRRGSQKTITQGVGRLPKKRELVQLTDLRMGLGKKEEIVFLRVRWLMPQCTLC